MSTTFAQDAESGFGRLPALRARAVAPADLEALAGWIHSSGDEVLIEDAGALPVSPNSLARWAATGLETRAIELGDEVVAFGTLSTSEAVLPTGTTEVCHLIVRPDVRRQYLGSRLVMELMYAARFLGFDWVIGRVVPGNTVCLQFLQAARWARLPRSMVEVLPDGFDWYGRPVSR